MGHSQTDTSRGRVTRTCRDPDVSSGPEVRGRCQHPVVRGSGTDGFAGVTGRVDFKDVVADGTYLYRGHLTVP